MKMHVQFLIKTPLPYLASYLTVLDHKSVEVCSVSLLQCDIQMQDVAVIHYQLFSVLQNTKGVVEDVGTDYNSELYTFSCSAMMLWLSLLHNFIRDGLNSGLAQV